jgi:Micrococcal nuclease (thermonuclease) homologs
MLFGTAITATVVRVVDGDTLRLTADGREESVRLLGLDTEESNRGSNKPVTPWGHKAKEAAQKVFPAGATVTLEFPGQEPVQECWEKHRDNYGRLLGYVHKDGVDVQEQMIHEGYSPYFVKYGYADFPAYHETGTRRLSAGLRLRTEACGINSRSMVSKPETMPCSGCGGTFARKSSMIIEWPMAPIPFYWILVGTTGKSSSWPSRRGKRRSLPSYGSIARQAGTSWSQSARFSSRFKSSFPTGWRQDKTSSGCWITATFQPTKPTRTEAMPMSAGH